MQNEPRVDISHKSKYFIYIAIAFVVVLILSNITAGKIAKFGPFFLSGATIVFPISFIFGDILTEVYGYKASRRIIWSGFASLIFMSFILWLVELLPSAPFWKNQDAYEVILGSVPRIVIASMTAYFLGEFSNSFVLSKMKVWMKGKHLWMRTIGSTVVGEGVDSIVFATIGFYGTMPFNALVTLILSIYIFKVVYEIIATPLVYLIVNKLKKTEGIDVYDKDISYNPFTLAE